MRVTTDTRFAIVPEWVLDADISDGAVRMACVLARYADYDTLSCQVSRAALAARMRCSPDTVDRRARELVGIGALRVISHRAGPVHEANEWQLVRVPPAEDAGGSRTDAARGSRTGAAGVAAPVRPSSEPLNEREIPIGISRASELENEREHPAASALCTQLADRITANGSRAPTITRRWLDSARLLIDRDRRDPAEARALIDWCQDDEFWRSNILSMPTFRARYDQLRLQAARSPPGTRSARRAYDAAAKHADLAERITRMDQDHTGALPLATRAQQ